MNLGNPPFSNVEDVQRKYFRLADPASIRKRIRRFRDLDFRNMSWQEVQKEVDHVVCEIDEGNGSPVGFWPVIFANYSKDTEFFRVVRHEVSHASHCYFPPHDKRKVNRLNRQGNPALYTSPNAGVAMEEMALAEGEEFNVITYGATRDISLGWITDDMDKFRNTTQNLTPRNLEVIEVIRDFLVEQFTRDVGPGLEYLYKISNVIGETYFNYPESVGYCYPSTVRREGRVNVCFYFDGIHNLLEVKSVARFLFGGKDKDGNFILMKTRNNWLPTNIE